MGIVLDDGVPVFIGPALEGLAALAVVHHHHADATAFLAAHDVDINHTKAVEFLPGELASLRITQFRADAKGLHYLSCDCAGKFFPAGEEPHDGPCEAATVQHTVEMRGPIPGWWRP